MSIPNAFPSAAKSLTNISWFTGPCPPCGAPPNPPPNPPACPPFSGAPCPPSGRSFHCPRRAMLKACLVLKDSSDETRSSRERL